MKEIFESIFDIAYLISVITLGIMMIKTSSKQSTRKLFGIMAVVLGAGDAFHLIPRIYAMMTTGIENNYQILGAGKLVTSITMTAFYIMLYYVWRRYFQVRGNTGLTVSIWIMGISRVILCLLPQNEWLAPSQPMLYNILRNIPFTILGIIVIVIFAQKIRKTGDRHFRFMPLAIILSFAFYIPVVLFAETYPIVGALMIPKTLAYFWIVLMGYRLPKNDAHAISM